MKGMSLDILLDLSLRLYNLPCSHDWPSSGVIEFERLSARYTQEGFDILKYFPLIKKKTVYYIILYSFRIRNTF